jgi:hypothetical protein
MVDVLTTEMNSLEAAELFPGQDSEKKVLSVDWNDPRLVSHLKIRQYLQLNYTLLRNFSFLIGQAGEVSIVIKDL